MKSFFAAVLYGLCLCCLCLFYVQPLRAENELFPFVISFDAPKNATNISHKLEAPAGKHGFVRVENGHFVTDQGRIQFWGTNTCFAANFLTHEQSERVADRLARFGINCVRLHHLDFRDIWGKNFSRTKMEFDPEQLDRLDYYVAALKKRGIYVNLNLHVSRSLDERDGFPKDENRPRHDKGIDNYYRPLIDANKKYAKDLLEHINPYTGQAYKDEPAVAMIEINNENSILNGWGGWGGLEVIQDPFLADLRTLWNDWLKKRYETDEALKAAWKTSAGELESASVPVIWKKEAGKFTKEAVNDFCDFLLDVEADYWNEMYRFLKDEIQVRQPVSGTQLRYGSTHAQAKMDYCDIHAYWNHPVFPGKSWDLNDWYVRNRALVNFADKNIFGPLATSRVYGKPFTLSEYNHPFPNRYAAEGLPLLAAFGAFQGWDGIFPFAYLQSNDPESRRITSFFDSAGNSVRMAHMIACQVMFCDMYNRNAEKDMLTASMSAEKERDSCSSLMRIFWFDFSGLGLDWRLALTHPVAVDVSGEQRDWALPETLAKDQKIFHKNDGDGDFSFDMSQPGKGYAYFRNGDASVFTGFVEADKEYAWGSNTKLRFGQTNLGWATISVALTRRDGRKRSYLLVATGETLNTDMSVEELGDGKITVGNRWGKAPVRCEGIPVTFTISAIPEDRAVQCWSLDESGNRKQEVSLQRVGQGAEQGTELELKPEYRTIWYEIEITTL